MSVEWPDHFTADVVGVSNGSSALSSVCIALEAWRRGLEVTFTGGNLDRYSVSDGQRTVDFHYSRPQSITRRQDYEKLDRKADTIALLRQAGVPTPAGGFIDPKETTLDELRVLANDIGYPLVIKPDFGSFGAGVMTGLQDWEELKASYEYLIKEFNPDRVVIEQHHTGDDYRLLVVGNQVVGAVRRVPAHVIGDGTQSISQLIEDKNRHRKRNPFLSGGLIKVDFEVEKVLAEQRVDLDDIPESGQYVTLRRVANASAGGDVVDVTDEIPEAMKAAAVQAVESIPRVVLAGVDVLYDPTKGDGSYVVIEMNSRPHIGVNMYPTQGIGRDAPKAVIDTLFPGTPRPTDPDTRYLRFDTAAIVSAIRSGATSRAVIPALPSHGFQYRKQITFEPTAERPRLGNVSRPVLLRLAHQHGVVGSVKKHRTGELVLSIATKNEATAQPIIRRVTQWAGVDPSTEVTWSGPISTSFTVS